MYKKKVFFTVIALVLIVIFSLSSCNNDEDEKKHLDVTEISLVDIGRINYEFEFSAETISDNVQRCKVRTHHVKKYDEIKSIEAVIKGNHLSIDIKSYPFDFDCGEDSCFTSHEVSFNLTGLKKGTYNVTVMTNLSSETNAFKYSFK